MRIEYCSCSYCAPNVERRTLHRRNPFSQKRNPRRRNPPLRSRNPKKRRKEQKKKARERKAKAKTKKLREEQKKREKLDIAQMDMEDFGFLLSDEIGQRFSERVTKAAGVKLHDTKTTKTRKIQSWIEANRELFDEWLEEVHRQSHIEYHRMLKQEELAQKLEEARWRRSEEIRQRKQERKTNWEIIIEAWLESETDLQEFVEEWSQVFEELNAPELEKRLLKRGLPTQRIPSPEQDLEQPEPEEGFFVYEEVPEQEFKVFPEPKSTRSVDAPADVPDFIINQMQASGGAPEGDKWVFGDAVTAEYFREVISETTQQEEAPKQLSKQNILILGGMQRNIPQWMHDNFNVQLIESRKHPISVGDLDVIPDLVIIFVKFISHNFFYSGTALATQLDIPYLTITGFSDAIVLAQKRGIDWFVEAALRARSQSKYRRNYRRHYRRNVDENLRNLKRRAASGDEETGRRFLVERWRTHRIIPGPCEWLPSWCTPVTLPVNIFSARTTVSVRKLDIAHEAPFMTHLGTGGASEYVRGPFRGGWTNLADALAAGLCTSPAKLDAYVALMERDSFGRMVPVLTGTGRNIWPAIWIQNYQILIPPHALTRREKKRQKRRFRASE